MATGRPLPASGTPICDEPSTFAANAPWLRPGYDLASGLGTTIRSLPRHGAKRSGGNVGGPRATEPGWPIGAMNDRWL